MVQVGGTRFPQRTDLHGWGPCGRATDSSLALGLRLSLVPWGRRRLGAHR